MAKDVADPISSLISSKSASCMYFCDKLLWIGKLYTLVANGKLICGL